MVEGVECLLKCARFAKGSSLIVRGPVRVSIRSGAVLVSGARFESGEFVVRHTRGVTLYAETDCEICYSVGAGGGVEQGGEEVSRAISKWLDTLNVISETGGRRIVVVGPVESGKSTFSLWTYNYLGLCHVEADIGQNEHGLPAMVSIAKGGRRVVVLQDLEADGAWFVGHVAPEGVLPLLFRGLRRAVKACGEGFVIDTDGYVRDRGVYHKIGIIELVEADTVVSMDEGLARRVRLATGAEVYTVPRPPVVRERDRVDRRAYRESAYARLFSAAERMTLSMVETPILNFEDCDSVTIEYDELARYRPRQVLECGRSMVVLSERPGRVLRRQGYIVLPRGWEKGLLAAIGDGDGEIPALVESIDFARNVAVLRAAWRPKNKPRYIMLGFIRLDDNYREKEKLDAGLYPFTLTAHATRPVQHQHQARQQ